MTLQPTRILLIEDESAQAEAIALSLEGLDGAELRVMHSLKEFLDEAAAWNPDIALMDLNLPDGQVMDVLSDPTGSRPFPVIVMTSLGSGQTAVEALKSCAFDYLVKSQETFNGLPHTVERTLREWKLHIEGKRMHQELKASEAQFRSLAESSTDFIMRYDRECRHTYLNQAALAMLGQEAVDIGKTQVGYGFPEELRHFWEAKIEQVFQTGQPSQTEFEFQSRVGLVTHDWRLMPEFDVKGKVHSVLGVSRDITERKRAEETLRESQESFAGLFEHAVLGVYRTSVEGRFLLANQALCAMLGYASFEDLAKCNLESNPTYSAAWFREKLAETSRVTGLESIWTRPNGETVMVRESARAIHDAAGTVLYFEGIVEDITERRRAGDALRRSEEKYRLAMEVTSDGLWDWNIQTGETYYSPGYFAMLGYQAEDFPVQHTTWLELMHPDDRANALRANQDCIEGRSQFIEVEFRMQAKNGEWRHILGRGKSLLRDDQGRALRLLGTHVDITERKRAEEKFTKIFQLSPDAIALTRSSDGVSQDLNSSYTKLFGYTPEEFIGHSMLPGDLGCWVNKEDRDRHMASLKGHGEADNFVAPMRRKDGSTFIAQISSSALEIDGEPHNLTITRDISERMQAEEELQEAHRFNEQIIRGASEGIIVYGPDLRYLVWNPFMEGLSGLPASEVLGRHPWEVFPFLRKVGFVEHLGRALTGEVLDPRDFPYHVPSTGKSGWVSDTSAPFHNNKGEIIGVIGAVSDITERKHTEETLRINEVKQGAMIANIADVIAIIDQAGINRYKSPNLEKWFGWKPEELVGQDTWKNIHPEDLARIQKVFTTLLSEPNASQTDQCRYLCKDGRFKWIEFTAVNLIYDPDIAGVLLNYHDISERRHIEDALLNSEEKYRLIFDYSPVGILLFDEYGVINTCNDNFAKIIGTSKEKLIGLNMLNLPDETLVVSIYKALNGNIGLYEDFYHSASANKVTRVRAIFAPMYVGGGRICGGVGVVEDITERWRTEKALHESEAENQALLSAIPDLIFRNRRNGEFLAIHAPDPSLLAAPLETIIHRTVEEILPKPFAEQFTKTCEAALDLNAIQELSYTFPIAGEEKHFEARVAPCTEDTTITMVRDITEHKKAEEQYHRLQTQLQQAQKMESIGILAGGMAHDMNNVLGAILGFASANIEAHPVDSRTYHAFDVISQAAVRGGKMVKSLLNYARQSPAEEREVDVNEVLREQVNLLERTTLSKVYLKLDLGSGLRPISGDASALTHAFMNLCVNAVDAMPENGTLTLRTRNVDSDWIEVLVEDTGTGMPREVLERAMDPFFTTKGIGKGTGLGLSMVYSTVKAHHGQIEILSEPGQGTRVRMRFPTCEVATTPPASAVESRSASSPGALNVLVVDDDELIQSTMQAVLEVLGHNVTAALSGEEALAKLEAGVQPDAVILDMNMPGLGGTGTLPRLRAMRPTVPVLLATGRADQAALNLIAAHPHVTLLSKPFSMEELQLCLAPFAKRPFSKRSHEDPAPGEK